MSGRLQLVALTTLGLCTTLSWADTILTPGAILGDPAAYQSQIVHVTGIVTNHRIRRRGTKNCLQSFAVSDETGSIAALQRASCEGVKNALRNRDVVTVEALFEWTPGRSGRLKVQSILAKVAPSAE